MYNNKFDKPYRNINMIDTSKIIDLFSMINNMNIQDIKQYIATEMISLAVVDKDGNNLIHSVLLNTDTKMKTEQQRLNVIQYLYGENVNPNAMNSKNITPLHLACMKQYYHIVKYLLEIGVDPNYTDNNGNTPFHCLLSGMIKLEDISFPGTIIPKSKTLDTVKFDEWKQVRNDIFEEIKKSPYLTSISRMIEKTISSSSECKEVVIEFQEELMKQTISTSKKNNMKVLKELKDISINSFSNIIEKMWNNFQLIKDIQIHSSLNTSWGPPTNSGLSVIMNTSVDETIENKLDSSYKLLENNSKTIIINPSSIDVTILNNKIETNKDNLIGGTLLQYNNIEEYYNLFKHPNAIDMADNIIDWDNYTFVGGSRAIGIVNEIKIDFILLLLKENKNVILKTMAYSLFATSSNNYLTILDYCSDVLNRDNYSYIVDPAKDIRNLLVKYIVEIIEDNVSIETENAIIDNTSRDKIYGDMINRMIYKRRTSHKISWLYNFITSYLCNMNLVTSDATNLSCNINQLFIYLISSMANNKGNDIKTSISQVLRPRLIETEIVYKDGFSNRTMKYTDSTNLSTCNIGSIYSAWIYLLLNKNSNIENILNNMTIITDFNTTINTVITDSNLRNIVNYTYNLFNNIELKSIITNLELNNNLNLNQDIKSLNEGELLCCMILQYYNMMKQKPPLQNIVDTLSLIRFKMILYKYEVNKIIPAPYKHMLASRLLFLYEKPISLTSTFNFTPDNMDLTNTMHLSIDPLLPDLLTKSSSSTTVVPYFKSVYNFLSIFGFNISKPTNEIAVESFLLSEYCLPSKIYFYLSRGFNYVDNIKNNIKKTSAINKIQYQFNLIIYLLKKIEASHLGLCFMGRLDNFNYTVDTDVYFYSHNNTNPVLNNTDRFFTGMSTQDNMAYCSPPTIYNHIKLYESFYNKNIQIQNKVNKLLLSTLNNLKQNKHSKSFSGMIARLYPVLTSLNSQFENINIILQDTMDKYLSPLDINNNILLADVKDDIISLFNNSLFNNSLFNNNFNITLFVQCINNINSYLYLYYYMKSPSDIKMPKLLYNLLGDKPIIAYDNDNSILAPPQSSKKFKNNSVLPTINKNPMNEYITTPNITTSSYLKVIENINNRIFFINKDIIKSEYDATKESKLPPSLLNVLNEFYKMNSIQLIVQNKDLHTIFDNIDEKLISENNLAADILTLQRYYIGSKISEELIQNFIKSKIKQVATYLYQTIIQNIITQNISSISKNVVLEKLFDNSDTDIDINKMPSTNVIGLHTNMNLLTDVLNCYNPSMEKNTYNKLQKDKIPFYLYPSDYNSTSLLNSKYTVSINMKIIELLIIYNANIYIHNIENTSPLLALIKQNNYLILNYIKNLEDASKQKYIIINYKQFNSSSSPYKYLLEQYNININKFAPSINIMYNIKHFVAPQFNEVKQLIQANDSYYNNILINLELSFSICNYMTQQYILEKVLKMRYDFTPNFNNFIDRMIDLNTNPYMIDCNDLYYNRIIGYLNISSYDEKILVVNIIEEYRIKYNDNIKKIDEYKLEKAKINGTIFIERNTELDRIIATLVANNNLIAAEYSVISSINKKYTLIKTPLTLNKGTMIERYDMMIQGIANARGNYIKGFETLLNSNSIDLFISDKIEEEKINMSSMNYSDIKLRDCIKDSFNYYKHINNITVSYFESPRYLAKNEVLVFVYNMLIHLTQNILCHNIELIIRKILFEACIELDYTVVDETIKFKKIINKINTIITPEILDYLYNEVVIRFVKNGATIYHDESDKASFEIQTVTEIMNEFIDLMLVETMNNVDNNIIDILKNSIVPYFDTIVFKTIANWNVCAENIFIFMINQYRYINMIECVM